MGTGMWAQRGGTDGDTLIIRALIITISGRRGLPITGISYFYVISCDW
ncbi:unnamed protein product, partial [Staurois parvus]